MNLAIITTLGANAGDNFVYEGFKNLFPTKHFDSTLLIDKTSIPKDDSYKVLINQSDMIVICGTPIFYKDCYKIKWQNKILEYSQKSRKNILLFAVGSNFKYSSNGTIEIPDINQNYINFTSRYNNLIHGGFIVRERYCLDFLSSMGFANVNQIVCSSFFASDNEFSRDERDLIFIIWGDTYWNCAFTPDVILDKCQKIQQVLQSKFTNKRVVWVCHDFVSYNRLLKHVSQKDVFVSNNYIDYFKFYRRCYFAFSIKLHGSMLLASMGVPSLLMQLDSRAAAMEALDEDYAPPSSSIELLIAMCDKKLENIGDYRDKISSLKSKYSEEYKGLFMRLGFI